MWTRLASGEPVLHGTPVWLRVVVDRWIPLGDSTLVVGLVVHAHEDPGGETRSPLLYHDGAYHRPVAAKE